MIRKKFRKVLESIRKRKLEKHIRLAQYHFHKAYSFAGVRRQERREIWRSFWKAFRSPLREIKSKGA